MASTQRHHTKEVTDDSTQSVNASVKDLSRTSPFIRKNNSLSDFVKVLLSVSTDTAEAKENEITMDDNNGRRIKYKRNKSHHH